MSKKSGVENLSLIFACKIEKNLVARFCKERNVFITTAPIRRSLHKKLHKVSHQFSFGLRPCKIVRTVKIIALNIESKSCAKIL